jgi:hypothetical protein
MFEVVKSFIAGVRTAKSPLQRNMEKALRMKKTSGDDRHIPEHDTALEGPVKGAQKAYNDADLSKQQTFASNLKRSHNPRSRDSH